MRFVGGLTFDEKMNSLCQPDQLFFIQFFDIFRRRLYLEPERILVLAVLEDAVACLRKYACCPQGKGKRLFWETMDWLMIKDDDWLFSFDNVCEALGLDAGYVRRGLIQMVETLVKSSKHHSGKSRKSGRKRTKLRNVRVAA
jgi:hypothetical protein